MGNRYKYYMKKYGTEDDTSVPTVDIEASYNGMIILQVSGLSSLGKPKNIYKETYAESSEVRVYIPENVARESTGITIRAAFVGKDRRDVYDEFCRYVSHGKIKYWDTVRDRLVQMVLDSAVELDDDIITGNEPFITADFKFTNIFGQSYKVFDYMLQEAGGCFLLENGNGRILLE